MARMVQSQLIVTELTRDRADALALVLGVPRAQVYRKGLEGGGLQGLEEERTNAELLAELDTIAAAMGLSRLELAARAARDRYSMADLRGRKRYPRKA